MTPSELIDILGVAARLKTNPRHCFTEPGRRESVADHSWRLALTAMLLTGEPEFADVDMNRVIRMCHIHDLGEAFTGDIPTFLKQAADEKTESDAMTGWIDAFPEPQRGEWRALWAEMEALADRFGRIDWRVPDASALYWSWFALRDAEGGPDELPCRRLVYSSLLSMMRGGGALSGDPASEDWSYAAAPNPAVVDATGAFIEETMRATPFSGVRHAYAGWLRDAIAIRMLQGREADARALYGRLVRFLAENGVVDGVPPFEKLLSAPEGFLSELLDRS